MYFLFALKGDCICCVSLSPLSSITVEGSGSKHLIAMSDLHKKLELLRKRCVSFKFAVSVPINRNNNGLLLILLILL